MKKHCIFATLLAGTMAWGPAASAPVIGIDFAQGTAFSVGSFINNVGWSFDLTAPMVADGLGVFDEAPNGLFNPHPVGLWNAAGQLLYQTTVSNASKAVPSPSGLGNWLFEDIPLITLQAGSYVVGAFYADDDPDGVVALASGLIMAPHVFYVTSLGGDGLNFALPGTYDAVQPGVFGPNVRFVAPGTDPVPVSEPASLALLALALLAAAGARLRPGQSPCTAALSSRPLRRS